MLLSLVIPAKDKNDPKLKELLASIDRQDFFKDQLEIIIVTEGTSESAKAIGIRQAKGEYICILASDNEIVYESYFHEAITLLEEDATFVGAYPFFYYYNKDDNCLNRYFALFGGNDPLPLYLKKNDRLPYYEMPQDMYRDRDYVRFWKSIPTLGDNGFVVRRRAIANTDLDNYYHIDNCEDMRIQGEDHYIRFDNAIWHKTGGNWLKVLAKRYKYALDLGFNSNRRWRMVTMQDIPRLLWFIICSLTIIQPLYLSCRGFFTTKIKDIAWFLHPLWCLLTLITYGLLTMHLAVRKCQSLFVQAVKRA